MTSSWCGPGSCRISPLFSFGPGVAGSCLMEELQPLLCPASPRPWLGWAAPRQPRSAYRALKSPSMADPSPSSRGSSFQGGPGAGWSRRREGCSQRCRGWLLKGDLHSSRFRGLCPATLSSPRALKYVLRPIPRELWQLFDVVAALLENGWAGDRSETRIFSSRLCGSFIKNRQINKQITAHYEHVLQFLFKQLFAVLKKP